MVPFENSTNGTVSYTLDLFADRHGSYPNVVVCNEAYLNVHHFLLGHRVPPPSLTQSPESSGVATPTAARPNSMVPSAKPLTSLRHIKRVYSHPQALGQCELFLSTFLRHAERHEVSSTSRAAQLAAEYPADSAAIASQIAATVNGLDTLAERVEDREDNATRFFILEHNPQPELVRSLPPPDRKNLVSFSIDHHSPGALAEALLVFKHHQLNLTSINSRPSRERPWHYKFFVEFNHASNAADSVNEALEDLNRVAKNWRWLGSWIDKYNNNGSS